MNKIILLLLLVPTGLFAERLKPIDPFGSLELSLTPNQLWMYHGQTQVQTPPHSMFVKMHAGFRLYKYFVFQGGTDIMFAVGYENEKPHPSWESYWFQPSLDFGWVEIGYRHRSSHPVLSRDGISMAIYDSTDEFFLRLEYNM